MQTILNTPSNDDMSKDGAGYVELAGEGNQARSAQGRDSSTRVKRGLGAAL